MRFNSKIILLVWLSVIDSLLMDIHVLDFSQHEHKIMTSEINKNEILKRILDVNI